MAAEAVLRGPGAGQARCCSYTIAAGSQETNLLRLVPRLHLGTDQADCQCTGWRKEIQSAKAVP